MAKTEGPVMRQVSRFALVGVLNTVVGVALIFVLYRSFGFGLVLANALGYGFGLMVSFLLNGSWTFGQSAYSTRTIAIYIAIVCAAFAINILTIQLLMAINLAYWIAQLCGVTAYSALVFLGMKYAVFTK